jgi:hypothetical protein
MEETRGRKAAGSHGHGLQDRASLLTNLWTPTQKLDLERMKSASDLRGNRDLQHAGDLQHHEGLRRLPESQAAAAIFGDRERE